MRIEEMERAVGEATKDSDLSRSALQKMRHMEGSLSKANRAFSDCSAMAAKLNAMNDNVEGQVRSHQREATYLVHLAANDTTETSIKSPKLQPVTCTKTHQDRINLQS